MLSPLWPSAMAVGVVGTALCVVARFAFRRGKSIGIAAGRVFAERNVADLKTERTTLTNALMNWMDRATFAEQKCLDWQYLVARYEAEAAEDEALKRAEAEWKAGMDERIWKGVEKQILLHRARYSTLDDLIGGRE